MMGALRRPLDAYGVADEAPESIGEPPAPRSRMALADLRARNHSTHVTSPTRPFVTV
jgi:hypothetical protein